MIRPLYLTVASAMLAIATPFTAIASAPAEPASRAPAASTKAAPKLRYCITETRLGSHIAKKTCLTREEWLLRGVDPTA